MNQTIQERNKALVLDAFDTLFNKRDYSAAEKFWSPNYIQHSAHIEPGREGLFNLIRNAPETLRYEHQLIVAERDYVIVHGRFSGIGRPVPGSPRILSGSRMAAWPNTGTSYKTRRQRRNRRAACRCLATASLPDPTYPSTSNQRNWHTRSQSSRIATSRALLRGEDRGQRCETAKVLVILCGTLARVLALSW